METHFKFCVNCKHFRNTAAGGNCWNEKNLVAMPPNISLVTGLPIDAPRIQKFVIGNLEVMRTGAGYCGEVGAWYEVKSLPEMIEEHTTTEGVTE